MAKDKKTSVPVAWPITLRSCTSSVQIKKTVKTINLFDPPPCKSQSSSSLLILSSPALCSNSVLVSLTDSLPVPPSPKLSHWPPPLIAISSPPSHSARIPSSTPLPTLSPGLFSTPLLSLPPLSTSSSPSGWIPFEHHDPAVHAAL
ncbi:hypothetical protein HMI56_001492 [Coelomomyces lativittatus]|nr:hypothetical protein HMI56_001492 [Coelomomyces lativittatus]